MSIPDDFPIRTEVLAHGDVHGIPWVAARAPLYGAVNGYCKLPDHHPWLDGDLYAAENNVPWGELTYGRGNWVGVDTLHAGQWWPGEKSTRYPGDELMTEEMAIAWAELLAHDAVDLIRAGTYCI